MQTMLESNGIVPPVCIGCCISCVYYCWVNSKAMAEGRECNSFLCYEVVKAAACMA